MTPKSSSEEGDALGLPPRFRLAHLPTPLWSNPALNSLLGFELWVKRDDMSHAAAAGNKIRKLEFLLKDAVSRQANVVVTCGGSGSNHARATALLAAELGLGSLLFLRTTSAEPRTLAGNLLLDRLSGANLVFIDRQAWARRQVLMSEAVEQLAETGKRGYLIGEGGSNGLGSLGYVQALLEIQQQLAGGAASGTKFDVLVHACGSGGTSAGAALGLGLTNLARAVWSIPVCDDADYFSKLTQNIIAEARSLCPRLPPAGDIEFLEGFKGPGYGVASTEQLAFIRDVARLSGLVLDPVYTGKALFALAHHSPKPQRALFLHTGGLPGLLGQADAFRPLFE
jgi:D-cysteine desulfhydrase